MFADAVIIQIQDYFDIFMLYILDFKKSVALYFKEVEVIWSESVFDDCIIYPDHELYTCTGRWLENDMINDTVVYNGTGS